MRTILRLTFFGLAAVSWLAAGPGGETTRAVLACSHEAMHHAADTHHSMPTDGPCFCDQMTGGLDLAVSTAVPTPPTPAPGVSATVDRPAPSTAFPLPPSPAFSPVTPPPNCVG